jgi:SAM-dependent methyltransferase
VWLTVSERVRWSRGAFCETPAGDLPPLPQAQAQRIAALKRHYEVRFESLLGAASSLNNYEYLDILDRAWSGAGLAPPAAARVCDVGCASFWYAPAMSAFFRPADLVGFEVEGHRLFRDGRSRIDYAHGYVGALANARFVVADYASVEATHDVITAWFPFLTATAILAWRLPLSLLRPARLFARIRANLAPGGLFFMVNHGAQEASLAAQLCAATGLIQSWRAPLLSVLGQQRLEPPVASLWRPAEPTRT